MKLRNTYTLSLIISAILIGSAINAVRAREAEAQTELLSQIPFAGQIASSQLCCNGIKFYLTPQYQSVARGSFIMEWPMMIPNPEIGLGLYSWWSLQSSEIVLGGARSGGMCQTVESECESSESVDFSVHQVGTTLMSAI